MTEQELIEQWMKLNRPEIMPKTLFTQQRVNLIKELIEAPSEQQHRLINLEIHYIEKNKQ